MLEAKKIKKLYGEKVILNDISIDIPKGKITSFIGANGAGKSTLLSIISRLIDKSEGDIFIDKKSIKSYNSNELAKKLGILKQSNHINIRITVRELVSFGRFPYSKGRLNEEDEKKIDEAIEYMGLTDMQDKYLEYLSGGQRQRAYIAMTVAQDTDYILLDEPLNNLDMKHSVQIMKILRKLTEDFGKTIVLVIHDINFASCYSDYIAALKDGKLIHFGRTDDIVSNRVLRDVFDMDFEIRNINSNKICIYFA